MNSDAREKEILNRVRVLQDQMEQVLRYLSLNLKMVNRNSAMEQYIMVSVQDIQAKADQELTALQNETSVMNAVKAVVDNQNTKLTDLKAQLDAMIAQGATPEALQKLSDSIDAIQAADTANAKIVADAVVAGTPVASDPGTGTGTGDGGTAGGPTSTGG